MCEPLDTKVNAPIVTSCKECVFAKWDMSTEIRTQIGCEFDRIRKFEDHDIKLEVVYSPDEKQKYYHIHRFCNRCRNYDWAEEHADWVGDVIDESRIPCDMIILDNSDENPELTVNDIRYSAEQVLQMTTTPSNVIFALKNRDVKVHNLILTLSDIFSAHNLTAKKQIKFEISRVLDPDLYDDIFTHIDTAVNRVHSTYYAIFEAGHYIPANFLGKLNSVINDDMISAVLIEPEYDTWDGFVCQTGAHIIYAGNKGMPIQDKLAEIAEEQEGIRKVLYTWDEL